MKLFMVIEDSIIASTFLPYYLLQKTKRKRKKKRAWYYSSE
jgi:hypothetical protein